MCVIETSKLVWCNFLNVFALQPNKVPMQSLKSTANLMHEEFYYGNKMRSWFMCTRLGACRHKNHSIVIVDTNINVLIHIMTQLRKSRVSQKQRDGASLKWSLKKRLLWETETRRCVSIKKHLKIHQISHSLRVKLYLIPSVVLCEKCSHSNRF